jgi:hypothetical protein
MGTHPAPEEGAGWLAGGGERGERGHQQASLSVNARLSALIASDLGVEGYRRTLEQPYVVHLGRNSSELITRLAYLGGISRGVLAPLLQGLEHFITAVVLVVGLLLYQPGLAMGLVAVFLLTHESLARLNPARLRSNSIKTNHYSQHSLKAQQEAGLIQSPSQAFLPGLRAWVEVGGMTSSLCPKASPPQPISI